MKNAQNRISAEDALNHPWFKKFGDQDKMLMQMTSPKFEADRNIFNMKQEMQSNDKEIEDEEKTEASNQEPMAVSDLMTSNPLMNQKR